MPGVIAVLTGSVNKLPRDRRLVGALRRARGVLAAKGALPALVRP